MNPVVFEKKYQLPLYFASDTKHTKVKLFDYIKELDESMVLLSDDASPIELVVYVVDLNYSYGIYKGDFNRMVKLINDKSLYNQFKEYLIKSAIGIVNLDVEEGEIVIEMCITKSN